MNALETLGSKWATYMQSGQAVLTELSSNAVRYEFMEVSAFEQLAMRDPVAANSVYVTEILYRAHFASAASIARAVRWAQGVEVATEAELFLPLCACLRGLLESAGDSLHSLQGVCTTLAEARTVFNRALEKKLTGVMITASELEDALIHFSHARRLTKEEKTHLPEEHRAKEAKGYIDALEAYEPGGWYEWYQELCERAHPASGSTAYMILSESAEGHYFSAGFESVAVRKTLELRGEHAAEVLRLSLAAAMVVLKVLTYFRLRTVRVSAISRFDFSQIAAWRNCAKIMKVPPA